jgi:signal transduction histidine kinase
VSAETGPTDGSTITVIDDGSGIDAVDLPQVFERLYVADRGPVRGPGGSGLGLAIVADLVSAMGGVATATSPALPDCTGARFTLSFPPPPPPPRSTPGRPPEHAAPDR